MADIQRVPITRLITVGGYVTDYGLESIIRGLDEDVDDSYYRGRGKVKITIEYTEDLDD